jgi:acylphosphatase
MALKRVHVRISGRVQGVFFRDHTQAEAQRLGLEGWVRNCPDGTVEAMFEGDAGAVNRMLEWCWRGSPASQVESVQMEEEPSVGASGGFTVRYY